MAALKPRADDGLLEVEWESHGIVVRIPVGGGGRLVLELKDVKASELKDTLTAVKR